jgi:hypothetical protein
VPLYEYNILPADEVAPTAIHSEPFVAIPFILVVLRGLPRDVHEIPFVDVAIVFVPDPTATINDELYAKSLHIVEKGDDPTGIHV